MPNTNRFSRSRRSVFAFAVLASTAWTPISHASEFPAVIPLSSLDGITGFRLDGAAGDRSGSSVASAGDVNGDGFADVIVGASGGDPAGSSYVVFGTASGFPSQINLSSLDGSDGFRIDGVSGGDFSGVSVASAGDVNGDGFDDLIIGGSGSSYVVFGQAAFSATVALSSLNGKNGFHLDSGTFVAGAGDINGDGFADVVVGNPYAQPNGHGSGSSYVVFGKASGFAASLQLSTLDGSNGFRLDGAAKNDRSGRPVTTAGDVNGDGFDDVILGARLANHFCGSIFVVFGKAQGFSAVIDLRSLDGSNGFRLDGPKGIYSQSGSAAGAAGDINGDGFTDLIIGAHYASPHGEGSGSSYVVFGKATGFAPKTDLSTLDGSNGFRLDGVAIYDNSGWSVGGVGDINGDGYGDAIVGAPDYLISEDHGTSYVVFGSRSGFPATINLSSLDGSNGFLLDGAATPPPYCCHSDASGYSVASAGDVNGDGFTDVIVGAPNAVPNGQYSGSSYVVFGHAPDSARTRVGSAAGQYISGGPFNDTLKGNLGDDVLEGRGGGDVLNGGFGSDTASYLHSAGPVKARLRTPSKNTGDAAGDTYDSIENLIGSPFADTLTGNGFANRLIGAQGSDLFFSGLGADLLVYNAVSDSPAGAGRDRIGEFDAGSATTSVDKIDLRAIDAKTGPGNQAFRFIGTAAFSGTKGQLRVEAAGTSAIIQGDVNGDGAADLEIELLKFTDLSTLTAIDFRL